MVPTKHFTTEQIKDKRKEIDAIFNFVREEQERGKEGIHNVDGELYWMAHSSAMVALKSAKMWLGVMLEARGEAFPAELADKA